MDSDSEDSEASATPMTPEKKKMIQPPKKPPVPHWAETPNLMKTLQDQTVKDPDGIFGAVKPLSLEGKNFVQI